MLSGRRAPKITGVQRAALLIFPLIGLVLLAFAGVLGLGFVGFDDPVYVSENPMVLEGLNRSSLAWAFSTYHGSTWLPLTWISHQLDGSLFGSQPAGHHGSSLLLHLINTLLLFHLLRRATGKSLAAFLVAGLWAVHPLRVESVAWVSSRKDLVSGLFFLCMLLAWLRYAEKATLPRYSLALLLCAAGLCAKQVLVTAPFVLLLLDFWPLGRSPIASSAHITSKPETYRRLLLEKIPFALLSIAASWVASQSQRSGIEFSPESADLLGRGAGALLAYGSYLRQSLLPIGLAAHYPFPEIAASWPAAIAIGLALLAMTLGALIYCKRHPALAVGWFWFAGMLVPMLGLVSFGIVTAHADRFTYLPHMGLALAIIYGLGPWVSAVAGKHARPFGLGLAFTFLLISTLRSSRQCATWANDATLWEHALAVAGSDATTRYNLAEVARRSGDNAAAIEHLEQALQHSPEDPHIMKRLGALYAQSGRGREAAPLLRRAAEVLQEDLEAQINHGSFLTQLGDKSAALVHLERALELAPEMDMLRAQVASLREARAREAASAQRWDEAIRDLRYADQVEPNSADRLRLLQQIQLAAGRKKAAARTAERLKQL